MGNDLVKAKERVRLISRGRYACKNLTTREAKERLLEVDPGLDISRVLQAVDKGEFKRAGVFLVSEVAVTHTLSYFAPLLSEVLQSLLLSFSKEKAEK